MNKKINNMYENNIEFVTILIFIILFLLMNIVYNILFKNSLIMADAVLNAFLLLIILIISISFAKLLSGNRRYN